jgi:hypothetical protein
MKFYIYIENRMVAEVEGIEFAYEVYRKTAELADLLGEIANLVDGDTGEIIESSDDWEDYDKDYEPDSIYSELGFDPFAGCFTGDC